MTQLRFKHLANYIRFLDVNNRPFLKKNAGQAESGDGSWHSFLPDAPVELDCRETIRLLSDKHVLDSLFTDARAYKGTEMQVSPETWGVLCRVFNVGPMGRFSYNEVEIVCAERRKSNRPADRNPILDSIYRQVREALTDLPDAKDIVLFPTIEEWRALRASSRPQRLDGRYEYRGVELTARPEVLRGAAFYDVKSGLADSFKGVGGHYGSFKAERLEDELALAERESFNRRCAETISGLEDQVRRLERELEGERHSSRFLKETIAALKSQFLGG